MSSTNFPCGAKVAADLPELLQSLHLARQLQVFPWQELYCPFHEVLEFLAVAGNMVQITEFVVVNCIIAFMCNADLLLCNIFLFGHSFLKKQKPNTKKLNQQTLLL